jgi:hypothetical protein
MPVFGIEDPGTMKEENEKKTKASYRAEKIITAFIRCATNLHVPVLFFL